MCMYVSNRSLHIYKSQQYHVMSSLTFRKHTYERNSIIFIDQLTSKLLLLSFYSSSDAI